MTTLAPNTIIQYRSRLRILKAALDEGLFTDKGELELAARQVADLEAKLGDDVKPKRSPGRPRKYVRVTLEEIDRIRQGKEGPDHWSKEAREARARSIVEEYQAKQNSPEESAIALEEMQKLMKEASAQDELVRKANEQLGGDNEGQAGAADDLGSAKPDTD